MGIERVLRPSATAKSAWANSFRKAFPSKLQQQPRQPQHLQSSLTLQEFVRHVPDSLRRQASSGIAPGSAQDPVLELFRYVSFFVCAWNATFSPCIFSKFSFSLYTSCKITQTPPNEQTRPVAPLLPPRSQLRLHAQPRCDGP